MKKLLPFLLILSVFSSGFVVAENKLFFDTPTTEQQGTTIVEQLIDKLQQIENITGCTISLNPEDTECPFDKMLSFVYLNIIEDDFAQALVELCFFVSYLQEPVEIAEGSEVSNILLDLKSSLEQIACAIPFL